MASNCEASKTVMRAGLRKRWSSRVNFGEEARAALYLAKFMTLQSVRLHRGINRVTNSVSMVSTGLRVCILLEEITTTG